LASSCYNSSPDCCTWEKCFGHKVIIECRGRLAVALGCSQDLKPTWLSAPVNGYCQLLLPTISTPSPPSPNQRQDRYPICRKAGN
jgi:hypothetical protein